VNGNPEALKVSGLSMGCFEREVEMEHEEIMRFRVGEPLPFKVYHCIFDENKGVHDLSNPHDHEVIEAWKLDAPGYVFNGIAIKTEVGWKYGCLENYLE
jgi:hypothetical protein